MKPSFHQPLPHYPCGQPGSSPGGPASSLSVRDPDSLGSGLPKEKTLPAPPPLSRLGILEQSPGQYLSPPPLQSLRVFSHLPPEKLEPLWPLDPPWASSASRAFTLHSPDLLSAFQDSRLHASARASPWLPSLFQCSAQYRLLQEALLISWSARVSASTRLCRPSRLSTSPLFPGNKVQDTLFSPRDPPVAGGGGCGWRTQDPRPSSVSQGRAAGSHQCAESGRATEPRWDPAWRS